MQIDHNRLSNLVQEAKMHILYSKIFIQIGKLFIILVLIFTFDKKIKKFLKNISDERKN